MKLARKDFLWMMVIFAVLSIFFFIGENELEGSYKDRVANSVKAQATVVEMSHTKLRKSGDNFFVKYIYVGADRVRRLGSSFIDRDYWTQLESRPSSDRTIEIYVSKSNPDESYWVVDWDRRSNNSKEFVVAFPMMMGMLATIPTFLILHFVLKFLAGLKSWNDQRGKVRVAPVLRFPESSQVVSGSITSRLSELKGLLDRGLITDEDFEKKKSEILAGF